MCGIAGLASIARDLDLDTPDILRRMTRTLVHRGPDAEGFHVSPRVALGHRRLSIIDLRGGAQPMEDPRTGLVIVFNGEIYNYQELNAELSAAGFPTHSRSDTETLLHAWAAWGPACLDRLRGMFAFVIHDPRSRRLYGARDPYGKKPLYYHHQAGLFCFASEPRAILAHPRIAARLDPDAMRQYLLYDYVPAPFSIYEHVRKLPAGHFFDLDLEQGKLDLHEFWDPALNGPSPESASPADASLTDDQWLEQLRDRIRTAVRRRLISDAPLGIFLSGGIDSSIVAAAAVEIVGRDQIETFTLGFEDPEYDESPRARAVAGALGTRHHESRVTEAQVLDLIPRMAQPLDEPLADASILPTYLLAKFARERVTVALGGDGGDELFAGYDTFKALGPALGYNRLVPAPLHVGLLLPLAEMLPASYRRFPWQFKLKRFMRGLKHPDGERLFRWLGGFDPHELAALITPQGGAGLPLADAYALARGHAQRVAAWPALQRDLYGFTKLYLGEGVLTKVDRATMACSLEARCPLLDIDLASFLSTMPARVRFPAGPTKGLLRKALTRWIGNGVADLPKRGFGIPTGPWLRGKLKPLMCDMLAPDRIRRAGIFHAEYVDRLVQQHLGGAHDHRKLLWSLLMFEMWRERWKPSMPG